MQAMPNLCAMLAIASDNLLDAFACALMQSCAAQHESAAWQVCSAADTETASANLLRQHDDEGMHGLAAHDHCASSTFAAFLVAYISKKLLRDSAPVEPPSPPPPRSFWCTATKAPFFTPAAATGVRPDQLRPCASKACEDEPVRRCCLSTPASDTATDHKPTTWPEHPAVLPDWILSKTASKVSSAVASTDTVPTAPPHLMKSCIPSAVLVQVAAVQKCALGQLLSTRCYD